VRQGLFLTIVAVVSLGISIVVFMFLPEYIRSGGPLVALLVMLSIMSVTLVFERLFTLARARGKEPIPTFMAKDAAPMPANQYVKVVVPLYYQGHAYRAGSRIRVTISAPNGSQPVWAFANALPAAPAKVSIAFSTTMPSRIVLPVVPGLAVPTAMPACPSLRNQPCRPYQATTNNP